jgi:hypothetical protein
VTTSSDRHRYHGVARGYRSGLEEAVADDLRARGEPALFEKQHGLVIRYVVDAESRYTPDFVLRNGVIVETKGRFLASDRTKHLRIKRQHPQYDIRFVFERPNARLSKTSTTTYAEWCDKHGFLWAAKRVPDSWLEEAPCPRA